MQTFLPYPDIAMSLRCLDYKRLGKQRVEAMQLVDALTKGTGWRNHPCCDMWRNNINALKLYHNMSISAWVERGYNNTMVKYDLPKGPIILPSWFGVKAFHDSHKSNLLRKQPRHYSQFNWDVPDDLEYVWPVGEKHDACSKS